MQRDADLAKAQRLAVVVALEGGVGAEAAAQQRERGVGGVVGVASAAGVVAVGVGDERPRHGPPGIDVEVAPRTVEAVVGDA